MSYRRRRLDPFASSAGTTPLRRIGTGHHYLTTIGRHSPHCEIKKIDSDRAVSIAAPSDLTTARACSTGDLDKDLEKLYSPLRCRGLAAASSDSEIHNNQPEYNRIQKENTNQPDYSIYNNRQDG